MHTASVSRQIDAPIEAVWSILDDFGDVASYNPGVETSRIVDGPDTGPGATRECVFHDGSRIEERIVDYESGVGYTVDFVDVGEFPLKENVVELDVTRVDGSRTAVTMTSTFRPKYGPVGWLMARTMMRRRYRETFERVLDGLESYARSGRPVDRA